MENKNLNNLEVLSPAGNPECFFADLNSGANAIYLGLSNFNARMKAENFTTENIKFYVDKAHLMGVKIYVTINTLINDDDFDELISLVKVLIDAKVDAYIIQDLGVAYVLKNTFENIVLHASTQLGIHNLQGAKVAESLGFKRIVLSRETKLEDIRQIKDNTNLEIEYFVQGALCVAFSGNCYLSSIEKQKSGNEGKCLQLCRLPYSNNLTNETAYNLSARDLSLLENLEKLIDAGVTSFKIEGRLKHAGYCAVTTKTYSDAINKIKLNEFTNEWIEEQYLKLSQTFSRGEFNKDAYLSPSTPDNIIYKDFQNHIGTEIGSVISVEPFKNNLYKVLIKSDFNLNSGDGIKIINKETKEQICSLGIGSITKTQNGFYEFITKYKFPAGNAVFLTQNSKYENELLSEKKIINISLNLFAFSDNKLKAVIEYNKEFFEFESDFILEKAKNSPLSENDFFSQLSKLNDTDFRIKDFKVNSDGVFIPKSMLNKFRRELIENLKVKIIENYNSKFSLDKVKFNNERYTEIKENSFLDNLKPKKIAIIDDEFNNFNLLDKFDIVVFKPSVYNIEIIKKYFNILNNRFALNLPTIANYNDLLVINDILSKLPKNIFLYANNIYGLFYNKNYNVIPSPLLNIKNTFAIKCLLSQNISSIVSSIESSIEFSNKNNLIPFSGGKFPLMTFAHCPFKTIFQNTCKSCTYNKNLKYINPTLNSYKVDRIKIYNCYFELNTQISQKNSKYFAINFSK